MYTYLIKQDSEFVTRPLYKIGRSKDVESRLNQLSTCQIHNYTVIACISRDVEQLLHNKWDDYRVKNNREWFDFPCFFIDAVVLPTFYELQKVLKSRRIREIGSPPPVDSLKNKVIKEARELLPYGITKERLEDLMMNTLIKALEEVYNEQ